MNERKTKNLIIFTCCFFLFSSLTVTSLASLFLIKKYFKSKPSQSFLSLSPTSPSPSPSSSFTPISPPTISLPTSTPTLAPANPPAPKKITSSANPSYNIKISEQDLWNALTAIRKAHHSTDLTRDQKLCNYARKRVNQLITRLQTLSPNQDPLDQHQGFINDTNKWAGTGFTHLSENLAYVPSYTTAVQIIEWAWDQSSGHRQNQLSNQHTHACIAGIHPFYVAIFGSN